MIADGFLELLPFVILLGLVTVLYLSVVYAWSFL